MLTSVGDLVAGMPAHRSDDSARIRTRSDLGHRHRDQLFRPAIQRDLQIAHQLPGGVDPHVGDLADSLQVIRLDRQPTRIAARRHGKALCHAHRQDLVVAVSVQFGQIAARGQGRRADPVHHRIPRRRMGKAVADGGTPQRQFAGRACAVGHRHFAPPVGQQKRLGLGQRERPLIGGGLAVLGSQGIAVAHVFGLQIADQRREEQPEAPDRQACKLEVAEECHPEHGVGPLVRWGIRRCRCGQNRGIRGSSVPSRTSGPSTIRVRNKRPISR